MFIYISSHYRSPSPDVSELVTFGGLLRPSKMQMSVVFFNIVISPVVILCSFDPNPLNHMLFKYNFELNVILPKVHFYTTYTNCFIY